MPENSLPVVVIACKVFQNFLEQYLPTETANQITWLDYGLHAVPKNLNKALQEAIDSIENPSLIMLGYGLCGNGLHKIQSGKHTLLVPRTDDCIAILLGSYQAYKQQFDALPATYYLSKGWLESGSNPLEEHQRYVERYGAEKADWLMDQQYTHYVRLAYVAHQVQDLEAYRPRAQEVAAYCERWGMRYEEILGSDAYVRRLVEVAAALDQAGKEFVVVPPGGELQQQMFLRWE
jgi:hypothetical protein